MKRIFLLGAKDPEMDAIEKILQENGQKYIYASIDGERCHPGNSYVSDHFYTDNNSYLASNDLGKYNSIVYIECNTVKEYKNTVYIDHHKEGDYGYDMDHKDFLEASSIGQLIKYLIEDSSFKGESKDFYMRSFLDGFLYFDDKWSYRKSDNEFITIPKEYVVIAASDHSLLQAYQGDCLGIDKNKLTRTNLFIRFML